MTDNEWKREMGKEPGFHQPGRVIIYIHANLTG